MSFIEIVAAQLKNARLIIGSPSPVDPRGQKIYVQCTKHPQSVAQWIEVDFVAMGSISDTVDAAKTALAKCKICADITTIQKTRFPEGAEL